MGARIRAFDWEHTPLGSPAGWPQSLRSPVSMMLPSKAQIIMFWGPEYVVLYNDAYRPVFGKKHPAMLGQPGRIAWSEVWETGVNLRGLLDGVVQTGEAFSASDMMFVLERHGFAEETYFDVSYDPVRNESGAVGGVYCIVTETTGRVVGERRLALLRELAVHSAAASPREACALAMGTLATRPWDIPFALAYLDGALAACTPHAEAALAAARPGEVAELALPPGSGSESGRLVVGLNMRRPYDEQYCSFLDLVAGQLATAIASAHAYDQEKQRAAALAEIDRAKTAFFSNVSHEFRTPLTLMLGPIEELLARPSLEGRDALLVVQRNSQRLLKLVNTLLDFARIEAGRAQASYEETDVAALTADIASNFRSACDKAGLTLDVDCPREVRAWVDGEMWEKIVLNLLSNAFKYTFEGGITVGVEDAGPVVRLVVADTGIGIPADSLERVFERFHRVEGARGRSYEGSGIGLALVQELVRLQGGTISATSEAGRGSAFTVELPRGNAHLPAERLNLRRGGDTPGAVRADAYVAEALGWIGAAAPEEPARTPGSATGYVLIADDNADLREYARRLLSGQYEVETVGDGAAALVSARRRRPDLVISDVMMPTLDGFALIRELRSDPVLASTPVLLLSARAGEEARLEGLQRGADDYLVKPFGARDLLGRVSALLQSEAIRRRELDHEKRFRAFVQASSDVVYSMNADWSEMRSLQGRSFIPDQEEPNRSWLDKYIHPDDRQRVTAAIHSAIATKSIFQLEYRVLRVDGTPGWTFSRAIPIVDAGGEIVEWLGAASDITARKAAEEALKEASRRKDEFLATLSHELRNPLAPLSNALSALRLNAGGAADPLHDMMERQLNHLVRLVDDLLEVSRITRGTFELRREAVELSAIVRNAVETSAPLMRMARHRLDVSLPGTALWLQGDPVRLAQIFSNLLNNAAKYTDDEGRIALSVRQEGRFAAVSVRDNGRGIAPERLTRIFEMFSREGRENARFQGGLGIGLSLARRLAEMHAGTIEAFSEGEGRGSEFVVRFPLAQAPTNGALVQPPRGSLDRLSILVVDDNEDAATSLALVLRGLGAEVRVAHDGPTAIDAFDALRPSAVLLDIGMPEMDGYEVARRLRARDPARRTTIVALTGWGQEDDQRRAREAGFDHHLIKPAELGALREILAAATPKLRPP